MPSVFEAITLQLKYHRRHIISELVDMSSPLIEYNNVFATSPECVNLRRGHVLFCPRRSIFLWIQK